MDGIDNRVTPSRGKLSNKKLKHFSSDKIEKVRAVAYAGKNFGGGGSR